MEKMKSWFDRIGRREMEHSVVTLEARPAAPQYRAESGDLTSYLHINTKKSHDTFVSM